MHRLPRLAAATALLLVVALPLVATTALALAALADAAGWQALVQDPRVPRALGLSLWTGLASTVLAWWGTAALLAQASVRGSLQRMARSLPVLLATPHAAFAIGLAFLLAPGGWVLRSLSPWLTGLDTPPHWPTTQDPWGLGLIATLVAKEIPFLLWAAATQWQREDLRARWRAEQALATTLGYGPRRAWWRVVWPQLAPRLHWPLLAVLAYGLTVVDLALVIGPASPPTLAVLAWQGLQDADPVANAQGAAAGGVLAMAVGLAALASHRLIGGPRAGRLDGERTARQTPRTGWPPGLLLLAGLYALVLLALAAGSVAGQWTFPAFWPQTLSLNAWRSVAGSSGSLWTTLALGIGSTTLALAWSVAWLELAPRRWDRAVRPLLYLPLALPAVLWVVGLYGLVLPLRIEGHWSGLLLAHTLMVLPYVLLSLSPAYQGFDPRCAALAASLGRAGWPFLLQVKWPLLRQSLAASAAVGLAVSVAQYLPTLYVGAGRFATVTTEAVTLASGAQRALTSAYAGLQFLLPVLGFALAARIGRPRRFTVAPP